MFRSAAVAHLVDAHAQGRGYSNEEWAQQVGKLRDQWNRASDEEKEDATAWLSFIYHRNLPGHCPLIDLSSPLGSSYPPRGHIAPWGSLPYDWDFYFTERPFICSSCNDGWAPRAGACSQCGKLLLGRPLEPTDFHEWQVFLGLDLLDADGGLRLIEINGSNYGLKGYQSLCKFDAPSTKWQLFRHCYRNDPAKRRARVLQYLSRGWLPGRASMFASLSPQNKELDRLMDSKWDQRHLHPDPLPAIRSRQRKAPLLATGHAHYIVKPVDGICGKGVKVVERDRLKVPKGHIAEPLIPPRTGQDHVRVLRAGVTLAEGLDGTLHLYHTASYWRCNPLPFDPACVESVVTNLSRGAEPRLATQEDLKVLEQWLHRWAQHLMKELTYPRYELHTNFDQIETIDSR